MGIIITDSKPVLISGLAVLILFAGFSTGLLIIAKTKYTVTVNAKIIDVSTKRTGSEGGGVESTITYIFELEGKMYTASTIKMGGRAPKAGEYEKIHCNPVNPQEIENKQHTNVCIGVSIFSWAELLVMIAMMYRKRIHKEPRNPFV